MSQGIINDLYPLLYKYNEEGSLFGKDLMNYINLIGKLKSLDPEVAKGYILKSNAINVEKLINDDICAICLEPILKSETITKNKNCQHIFHSNCVQGIIKSCPKCRTPFIKKIIQENRLYFGNKDLNYLKRLKF
jgi:hypothetical protein